MKHKFDQVVREIMTGIWFLIIGVILTLGIPILIALAK